VLIKVLDFESHCAHLQATMEKGKSLIFPHGLTSNDLVATRFPSEIIIIIIIIISFFCLETWWPPIFILFNYFFAWRFGGNQFFFFPLGNLVAIKWS
jgi:hypothetical protein